MLLSILGQFLGLEVGHALGHHLGIGDGDGHPLHLDRFPVEPAELIDLCDELLGHVGVERRAGGVAPALGDGQLDGIERVRLLAFGVSLVVVEQVFVAPEVHIGAAEGHAVGVLFVEGDQVFVDRRYDVDHVDGALALPAPIRAC